MARTGGPPVTDVRRPGRVGRTSRWFCLILVLCWAVPGAAMWVGEAFVPQSPDGWIGWVYSVPSWVSLVAELTIGVLFLGWVILPVLLLAVGFDYLRNAKPTEWRWRGAWIGAVGAGLVLEALLITYPGTITAPDWHAFAKSLCFVAISTVMIFLLFGAARSKATDHPRPGNLPGSAVA